MRRLDLGTVKSAVGQGFVNSLGESVLIVGTDRYSKHEVAQKLGIVHVGAARLLSSICKDLGVRSVKDLYAKTSPYSFTDVKYRCGVTTLFTLFALFHAEGLDVRKWYQKGAEAGEKPALRTFTTLKLREARAEKRSKR
jgi:hypothetical protein